MLRVMLLGVAVVLVVAVWQLRRESARLSYQPAPSEQAQPTKLPSQVTVLPADPVRGAATAPQTVVLFSDFQCPYCAEVAPILAQAVAQNGGRWKLVWKDFPLPSHPEALAAAEAAQCAGSQGRFWEYHDQLFQRQATLGPQLYQALALELNLSPEPFQRCLAQHTFKPFIEHSLAEGAAIGVDATPFLVVGSKVYRGTFTAEELAQFLE